MKVKNIILGNPLRNNQLTDTKLSRVWGLPIMASDAVSSVAYSIEEILLVLVPIIGLSSYLFLPQIVIPIITLLFIIVLSYSQIIKHYPHGGGSYAVSRETIGHNFALLAASALIVDYILTVAVSVSSASAAITSAFPILSDYAVGLSLLFVAIITVMNLRGVKEVSKAFGAPTYLFIGSMLVLIIVGLFKLVTGDLEPLTYPAQAINQSTVDAIVIIVFLRAFASGCSAMSGVEAVSNAVPSFKTPSARNARDVLIMLALIIFIIFGGTSILAMGLHVMPIEGETVISQLAYAVFGSGMMYYLIQFTTAIILILAANTAYNGLPQLLYILADDMFVPKYFLSRGTKLSFSNGIMLLSFLAALLIVLFNSDVHALIPLYSVGVFISFTLAQFGMFRKWSLIKEPHWQYKRLINLFGALVTLIVLIIVMSTKFLSGAWILLIIIPGLMFAMHSIHNYYQAVKRGLSVEGLVVDKTSTNEQCIVMASDINKPLLKALNYASSISSNITVLHICRTPEESVSFKARFADAKIPYELVVIETDYRDIIEPIDRYLTAKEASLSHHQTISVILIKYVTPSRYGFILHNHTTFLLREHLTKHKDIITIEIPFHYDLNKSYYRRVKSAKVAKDE